MVVCTETTNQHFFIGNLKIKAKNHINENPGVHVGNLRFLLQGTVYNATKNEISIVFLQLMKEGYFFTKLGTVYPPNSKLDYRKLETIIIDYGLNDLDLEIFLAVENLGLDAKMGNVSRKIVSLISDYEEIDVKYRINVLFMKKFLLAVPSNDKPQHLLVNPDLMGEIE